MTAWVLYSLGIFVAVRLPVVRLVIPIVVLAFVAPFVAGPERLTRVLQRRRTVPAVVIDVTPRGAPGEPEPPRHVEGEVHRRRPGATALTGPIALHGGGEYVTGDERAMDALLGAARAAAGDAQPVVVILPTAAARQRPEQAAAHGERAFRARRRAGGHRDRGPGGADPDAGGRGRAGARRRCLAGTHLVHVPGGDPDLVPAVLRDTPAWSAILEALDRDACLAGASAGAMALGERVWTSRGGVDGLGLLPGLAVIPHFVAGRLDAWRPDRRGRAHRSPGSASTSRRWSSGRPGETWSVAGRGRVHLVPAGAREPALVAGPGAAVPIG